MIFSHTTAASLTLSFLCAFHRKDIQTVRLLSHPDMIWIRSSDNVSLKGRESVINFLCVQRQAGPFQIADYHYIPVTTDHGLIVLTARITLSAVLLPLSGHIIKHTGRLYISIPLLYPFLLLQ